MASIKLQGGKVITKNGKPSCTCCITECCMYPAQELIDGIYSDDDLPDELEYFYNFQGAPAGSIILQRSGQVYSAALGDVQFNVQIQASRWVYTVTSTPQQYTPNGASPCLFLDILGYPLKDTFPDILYVSATFLSNNGEGSFSNRPITRTDLCRWAGASNTVLRYISPTSPIQPPRDMWLLEFSGIDGTFPAPDGQRLKTPIGSYLNRFDVINISVSE